MTRINVRHIRFWILFLFFVRLYGIWFPPLEVEHNWRQTTVAMVARNFLEVDNNILYPRVDMAGTLTGITGMEFPLLNYLIYTMAKVFGYQHWYGRLIVLLVSSLGSWYFYKLVKSQFSEKVAFIAVFSLLFSLWLAYSRKIMPDTFATSLAIIGLYYGFDYLKSMKWTSLGLYFVFGLVGLLSKLPVVFLFVYLIFPFIKLKSFSREQLLFFFVSLIMFLPVIWWYFVWTPYLTEHFGFWHFFMGKDFSLGIKETWLGINEVLERLFYTPLGISGLVLLIISLAYFMFKKEWKPVLVYLLGLIAFVILVVFKAGWTFHHHNYYILAYVPVFLIPIACFIDRLPKNYFLFLLLVISVEGVSRQFHEFRIKEESAKFLALEKDLDVFFTKKDLIIINSGNYPTPLYFSHRKGITLTNNQICAFISTPKFSQKGYKGLVILKKVFGTDTLINYPKVFDSPDYSIYKFDLTDD